VNYVVAIPSFGRPATVVAKTLTLLAERGVPSWRVTVWVHDDDQAELYRRHVDWRLAQVDVSAPGLVASKNAYLSVYERGDVDAVWNVDDDIDDVIEALDERTKAPVENLDELFKRIATTAGGVGARLAGVSAVPNPFYMRPAPSTSLKYVPAGFACWLLRPGDNDVFRLPPGPYDYLEDFARVCQVWERTGLVYRENRYAIVTKYWAGEGGHNATRTPLGMALCARAIADRWPDLVTVRSKGNGRYDVAFKPRRSPR